MITVRFNLIDNGNFWRAYIADQPHLGGTGTTPQEALGWLVLNHPYRAGVEEIIWDDPKPFLSSAGEYPEGVSEVMD